MKLFPRSGWTKPVPELPQTAEGLAEYIDNLKAAKQEWEEFVARGVRIVAYTRKHPLRLGHSVENQPRLAAVR